MHDVPLDTSASAIVIEQPARITVDPELARSAPDLVKMLPQMLDGVTAHLTPDTDQLLRAY